MTTSFILIRYFCPALGTTLANLMWLSSLPLILLLRHVHKSLDDVKGIAVINPYPFLFMVLNCLSWSIYSYFIYDFFVYFSNVFGLLLGCFYCLSCLSVFHSLWKNGQQTPQQRQTRHDQSYDETSKTTTQERDSMTGSSSKMILAPMVESGYRFDYYLIERVLIAIFTFWLVVGLISSILLRNENVNNDLVTEIVGLISLIFTVSYYASPLSMMFSIIQKKDSSSLYLPMIIVNCINAAMWFLYGLFGRNDKNIWIPNGIGVVLAVIQLVLICIFPAKREREQFFTFHEILQLIWGNLPEGRGNQSLEECLFDV